MELDTLETKTLILFISGIKTINKCAHVFGKIVIRSDIFIEMVIGGINHFITKC